jgi:hypothetical protein
VRIVDHLIARKDVPAHSGLGYDYVLAGDGVYVQTENAHLHLRIPVAPCRVRGLPEVGNACEIEHGRIPQPVWEEAVLLLHVRGSQSQEHPRSRYNRDEGAEAGAEMLHERSGHTDPIEAMVAIVWNGDAYEVVSPSQDASASHVTYEKTPETVLELHSHHRMRAYFSPVDDIDEQGLGLYAVVGRLHTDRPEVVLRAGAYGHFLALRWEDVFEGDKGEFRDALFDPPTEREREEAVRDAVYGDHGTEGAGLRDRLGRMLG